MGDISSPETGSSQPILQEGKIEQVWRSIRERFRKNRQLGHLGSESSQGAEFSESHGSKPSLQEILDKALIEQNINTPGFKSLGVSEFFATNETFDPRSFEALKLSSEPPNGCIIGISTTSILSLLELFSGENPPKGMVFINIDPRTIADAKRFTEALKRGKFLHNEGENIEEFDIASLTGWDYQEYQQTHGLPPASEAIWNVAQIAKKLAEEDKIAVIQQDIFNPKVLEIIIQNIPRVSLSRNVIYLSNVGDWIRRDWETRRQKLTLQKTMLSGSSGSTQEMQTQSLEQAFACYKNLDILSPTPPNFNYYVDTSELPIEGTKAYQQRVSKQIPGVLRYTRLQAS